VSAAGLPRFHVVLVEPEIPANTGNIARTCLAAGAALHLVKPLGFSLDERQLRRAGMDYWDRVDVRVRESFREVRESADPGARFYFLSTKAGRAHTDAPFRAGDYLVFGRETKGLPEAWIEENRETAIRIPMLPGARSLNLAVSVGIALYEAIRRASA
jgi:tRNA (cytidine/uridine-2'-O-)-methyltransferase